jgi:hypothetical protein
MGRVAALALRVAEADEETAAARVVGFSRALQQVEGLAVPAQRLVGCEQGQGASAGSGRVVDGFVWVVAGREPVVGKLADALLGTIPIAGFECPSDAGMHAATSSGA